MYATYSIRAGLNQESPIQKGSSTLMRLAKLGFVPGPSLSGCGTIPYPNGLCEQTAHVRFGAAWETTEMTWRPLHADDRWHPAKIT